MFYCTLTADEHALPHPGGVSYTIAGPYLGKIGRRGGGAMFFVKCMGS